MNVAASNNLPQDLENLLCLWSTYLIFSMLQNAHKSDISLNNSKDSRYSRQKRDAQGWRSELSSISSVEARKVFHIPWNLYQWGRNLRQISESIDIYVKNGW